MDLSGGVVDIYWTRDADYRAARQEEMKQNTEKICGWREGRNAEG